MIYNKFIIYKIFVYRYRTKRNATTNQIPARPDQSQPSGRVSVNEA